MASPHRQAERLAAREADLIAQHRAGDPAAAELAAYLRHQRERLETRMERSQRAAHDPRQESLL